MDLDRRTLLQRALFGAGMLGLRSLASGIPMAVLAHPRRALAAGAASPAPAAAAQYLIWSHSALGDPVGANVPGTYGNDPNLLHPADPSMAPTPIMVGGHMSTAAKPWAQLPQALLDRTCFFHHSTNTVLHTDSLKVNQLMHAVSHDEVFVSLLAQRLAPALGTVQAPPVTLTGGGAGGGLPYAGVAQSGLTPTSLAAVLTTPKGPIEQLQALRDRDVNALNDLFRRDGTPAQRAFLDQYARSQDQARTLTQTMLGSLEALTDDSPASQLQAAVTLIQMQVAPVIVVDVPFGGDNHVDAGLAGEAHDTVASVGSLAALDRQLAAAGLSERATVALVNVFGRSLGKSASGAGRNHNANHSCAVLMGRRIRGSLVGGVVPFAGDYAADAIGPISRADTLTSMAKTLAAAVGVEDAFIDANIAGGARVDAALR